MLVSPIRLFQALCAALLGALVVAVFVNVVLRFVFNTGLVMTEELSRIGLIWIVFLGAIVVLHRGQHIAMTMVIERLPRGGQIAAVVLGAVAMIGCDVMLLLGAWRQLGFSLRSSFPVSGLPTAVIYAPAILAACCFAAVTAWRAIAVITGRVSPQAHFGLPEASAPSH